MYYNYKMDIGDIVSEGKAISPSRKYPTSASFPMLITDSKMTSVLIAPLINIPKFFMLFQNKRERCPIFGARSGDTYFERCFVNNALFATSTLLTFITRLCVFQRSGPFKEFVIVQVNIISGLKNQCRCKRLGYVSIK